MAQTDTNCIFTGGNTGSAQAITSAAVRSTGILDLATGLMNIGTTYSAAPLTIGNASVFAEDLSSGFWRMRFAAMIGATFTGGTSLNVAIQGAVDASAGTYPANLSGLTWVTYAETGAIPVANLVAPTAQGTISDAGVIMLPDWPHRMIKTNMPRFISLLYTPVGTFGAGTISTAGMFQQFPDFDIAQYPSGFTVGA
jgi:hypothetical protein